MSTLDARLAAVTEIYGQAPPMRRMSEREFDAWIGEKTRAEWVDGEVVVAQGGGLDFEALQQRIHPAASRVNMLAKATPAAFIAFDLLALGGAFGFAGGSVSGSV